VPKVYWQYSTSEVLVLEYAPGTKINDGAAIDRMGLDRQKLARLSVESYLQQILRHGFFHVRRRRGACNRGVVVFFQCLLWLGGRVREPATRRLQRDAHPCARPPAPAPAPRRRPTPTPATSPSTRPTAGASSTTTSA
jgi:hypothetical protein